MYSLRRRVKAKFHRRLVGQLACLEFSTQTYLTLQHPQVNHVLVGEEGEGGGGGLNNVLFLTG